MPEAKRARGIISAEEIGQVTDAWNAAFELSDRLERAGMKLAAASLSFEGARFHRGRALMSELGDICYNFCTVEYEVI